jgi:4-carboxymuconolactone decarboxylase
MAAPVALNRPDQLRFHLNNEVENGPTKEDLIEPITHPAFFSSRPSAMSALVIAEEIFSNA